MWSGLVAIALGAPVGYWHPDDLAPLSKTFAGSSDQLSSAFEARQRAVEQLSAALRQYRVGLDLLGDRAPQAERDRLDTLEREYQRQHATLQAFADALIGDYDTAFQAAVDRALAKLGEATECEAEVLEGRPIPGIPPKTKPNPACSGRNLNPEVALAVDADATLRAAVDAILGRPWPEAALPREAQAPVGGGERWLSVHDLFMAGAADALRAIDQRDDDARTGIEARIEEGASPEELAKLLPEADRIAAETATARAALAAPVIAAAEAAMTKWKGEPAAGWCANPGVLGGCTGADQSRDLVGRLVDDKKVAKSWRDEN